MYTLNVTYDSYYTRKGIPYAGDENTVYILTYTVTANS